MDYNVQQTAMLMNTGPEKLLEVWFSPTAANLPGKAGLKGLKKVSVDSWKAVLDIVHCKVLSVIESDYMDAYLLSESSLFVFPHKLVLKTCGTTTLLYGLRKILEIAGLEAGFPYTPAISAEGISATATTHRVFYSRKNFQFPDQQRGVHKSWRDEVQYLDGLFSGSAYMIGKMNGEHWYLYISTPFCRLTPPNTPEAIVEDDGQGANTTPSPDQTPSPDEVVRMVADVPQDETLEILMTDLDEASAKQFYFPKVSFSFPSIA